MALERLDQRTPVRRNHVVGDENLFAQLLDTHFLTPRQVMVRRNDKRQRIGVDID
jgi:hypothetical protein